MPATTHFNLDKLVSGAVDWLALFNSNFDKIEAGRTLFLTAGEALAKGNPIYIKDSDGKAYKAIYSNNVIGIWQTASTAANAQGFAQIDGTMADGGWSWTKGGMVYVSGSKTLTQTRPYINVYPVAVAISATSIALLPPIPKATFGYAINVMGLSQNPTGGVTRYISANPSTPYANAGPGAIRIRKAGILTIAEVICDAQTVVGSNENWSMYVRVNNAADTLIQTVGSNTNPRIWTNSSLAISLAAGDYIEIKMINPTWATAPQGCFLGGYVYIEI